MKDINVVSSSAIIGGAAGFFTGLSLSWIHSPFELVKIKQQIATPPSSSSRTPWTFHIVKEQIAREGIMSLYKGYGGTLVRQSIGNAFFFGTYEHLKAICDCNNSLHQYSLNSGNNCPVDRASHLSPLTLLGCGSLAGVAYWTLVYPIDVLKAYVQTCSQQRGYRYYAQRTIQKFGWQGLFRGLSATLVRCVPVNGTGLMVYEWSFQLLSD